MSRIKILALSDSPFLNTGFSTITMNIMNRLDLLGYDCSYLGQAIPHPQILLKNSTKNLIKNWSINENIKNQIPDVEVPSIYLPDGTPFRFNLIGQAVKPYCEDVIQPWIKQIQPDIFFVLLDTFMVYPWFLDIDLSPAKSIFYYPSDGEPFLPGGVCDTILRKVTKAVAMSKFAQKQVKNYHKLDTEYIPHAIDTTLFYPLSQQKKDQLRMKWGVYNKFVVGCVARNQPRKMMDRTIKVFAKFAKDKEDVILLLHMDPLDVAGAFNLQMLIKELGILNKVLFTGTRYFQGFTYDQMRDIYNLMDVFCLLTSGEGFGIPTIEAMACEIPIVITDYTTTQELIEENGKCGESVRLIGTESFPRYDPDNILFNTLTGTWNVERGLADIYHGVTALNKIYYDRSLINTYGKTGRQKVLKYYTWDVVMPQWHRLFQDMLND